MPDGSHEVWAGLHTNTMAGTAEATSVARIERVLGTSSKHLELLLK